MPNDSSQKKERFQTLDGTTRSSLTKLTQFPAQNPSLTSLTGACIMKVNQPYNKGALIHTSQKFLQKIRRFKCTEISIGAGLSTAIN